VTEINAGDITASCPFAPATQLMPEPAGGTWSGDQITTDGIFSPQDVGTYSITYQVNGCTETLDIDVQEFTQNLPFDTLCQSAINQDLDVLPLGGIWSGSGIDDEIEGIWSPEDTGVGGDITLTYNAIGCSMNYDVFVIPSQIGRVNQNTCPFTEPYLLDDSPSPPGGVFEGAGIQDSITGLFDPGSVAPNNTYELYYHAPTGCTDTVFMLVQDTEIFYDSLYFCVEDEPLLLDFDGIQRSPDGGVWAGPGTFNFQFNDWEFNPSIAGVGEHEIFYENNTCIDSALMFVFPSELSQDTLFVCSADDPFILEELIFGGTWSGDGIIDDEIGLFDPSLVPGETVMITYSTPTACQGEMVVVVDEFIQAEFTALQEVYCYADIEVDVLPMPAGGELVSPQDTSVFNPSILGEGMYTFTYSFPDLTCTADTTISLEITGPSTVSLNALDTVLCTNDGTTLMATGTTNVTDAVIMFEWSDGLFPFSEHAIAPEASQFYFVTANDGCSELVTDSIFIEVLEPIVLSYNFGDTLCFAEAGASVEVVITPEADYNIMWGDTLGSELLINDAGSIHQLHVMNIEFGCTAEDVVLIPSFSPLTADFSVNPNDECIPFDANPVEFIDLSVNAVAGMWDFGNGDSLTYDGSSPQSVYESAGLYDISLIVENEGGCLDTAVQSICVLDPSLIFIPDIFSPNNDGNNDILYVRGAGILDLELNIYNRWGNLVFKSTDLDNGWDGDANGSKSPTGVYFYQLRVRTEDGVEQDQTGNVTLIR